MGRIVPLSASQQGIAPAGGTVTLYLYAPSGSVGWKIKRMVTSVSGSGVTANSLITLNVYTNSVSENNRKDGTQNAAQDTSETDIPLQSSEYLIAVYSGVPVGAACTFTVYGDTDTGR